MPILNAAEQNLQDAAKDETAINQSSSSNSSAGGNQTLTGGWFFKTKSALVGEPDFIGGPFATKQAAQAALDSRIENVFEGDKTAITLQVTHFN